jgi:prepilin-type N-terminal cleavage/methylation domain-containing protein
MRKISNKKGFTIIELMIAVTVFSMVLLILSYGIINIGRMYYKNITSARTQEASRSVMDEISGSVQFSSHDVIFHDGNPAVFCSGTDKYVVFPNSQVGGEGNHAIWREKTPEGVCSAIHNFTDGQELLSENMEVLGFSVTEHPGDLIGISLSLAHIPPDGEDLLEDSNGDGRLDSCLPRSGSHFCAVSTLDTTVKRRIN